jgi:hypothetical protein
MVRIENRTPNADEKNTTSAWLQFRARKNFFSSKFDVTASAMTPNVTRNTPMMLKDGRPLSARVNRVMPTTNVNADMYSAKEYLHTKHSGATRQTTASQHAVPTVSQQ